MTFSSTMSYNSEFPYSVNFILKQAIIRFIVALFIIFQSTLPAYAQHGDAIRVATFIEPPMVNFVNGKFIGENIDVARLLAKKLNKKVTFIQCPIARCLSMIKDGKADMIISLKKTAARMQYMTFLSQPFKVQNNPLRFYTLQNSPLKINTFNDLHNLSVGTVRGAAYFEEFDNNNSIDKVAVTGHLQLIQMLLKGRIDTFLEREETIRPLIDNNLYNEKIKLAKYQYNNPVYSYIAISKKSPFHQATKEISAKLKNLIANGEFAPLMDKAKIPKITS